MDKHYLSDLLAKGINIPKTHFIEAGNEASLKDLIVEKGWSKAILKPCFSELHDIPIKLKAKYPMN